MNASKDIVGDQDQQAVVEGKRKNEFSDINSIPVFLFTAAPADEWLSLSGCWSGMNLIIARLAQKLLSLFSLSMCPHIEPILSLSPFRGIFQPRPVIVRILQLRP